MAQVPCCRLRPPVLLCRLGEGRLSLSLGAGRIVSSLFGVRRLRGSRISLRRLWQIHDRGSLSSSGGYVESYTPEGGS
jgi:hypothetical protein